MILTRSNFIFSCFIIVLIAVLQGCKSINTPKSQLKISFSKDISIAKEIEFIDIQFGIHLLELENGTYLVYLNKSQKIVFVNLFDSLEKHEIDFSHYVSGCKVFDVKLDSAFLYFWNHDNRTFSIFSHINKENLKVENLYNFSKILNWEQYYIKYQQRNTFEIYYPTLYLAYGIYDSANAYLDSTAYLKINLLDSTKNYSITKIGPQPVATRKGLYYEYDSFISQIGDSEIVIGYRSYDSMYKLNTISDRIVGKNSITNNSGFLKFRRSQEANLSYVREYTHTTELNVNNLSMRNGNLLLVKRLRSNDIYDKKSYELYIINAGLEVILNKSISENINPYFLYSYSKGFLFFDSSLSKALYYEPF